MKIIDLSHQITENTTTYRFIPQPKITPLFTHEEFKKKYNTQDSYEMTMINMCTSTGTYIDSPFHRNPQGKKIIDIPLEQTITKGIVIDVSKKEPRGKIHKEDIALPINEEGLAILFYTGWDRFWGTEEYIKSPALDRDAVEFLIEKRPKIVGIDGINADCSSNKDFPAHTKLLANNILIVENLTNLSSLIGSVFTFYAVPLKIEKLASSLVRAFVIIE